MNKVHTSILYLFTIFLILNDVMLSIMKPIIMAFCLFLLHVRKAIPVVSGFVETSSEGICDFLISMSSFVLSVVESIQAAVAGATETEEKPVSTNKYSNMIAEAEEEILRNIDEPSMGFSEHEGGSISSKHRFSTTLQQYFSKKDRERSPRV